jgi:hypothetical protein
MVPVAVPQVALTPNLNPVSFEGSCPVAPVKRLQFGRFPLG